MALDWKKEWSDCKKEFERITGKKKPDAKVGNILMKHSSDLSSLIKKAENAHIAASNANPITPKLTKAFAKTVTDFEKGKNAYILVLQNAIKKDITDMGEKTAYSKACKYMIKKLDALHGSMDAQNGWLDSKLKNMSMSATTAANLVKSIASSALKCLAAAAKIKTNPTKDHFDDVIFDPARDLSQYLGNVARLRKKGLTIPEKYDDAKANALYDVIRPYGDDRLKRKIPADAEPEVVLVELKKFVKAVKVAQDYAKP